MVLLVQFFGPFWPEMLKNIANIFRIRFHKPTKMIGTLELSPLSFLEFVKFEHIIRWRVSSRISIGMFFLFCFFWVL